MNSTTRLNALDLLRFVAALAVVAHHWHWPAAAELKAQDWYPTWLAVHGGYFGVSLFFLISGCVILMSAQGATAREFVVARVIRLYPAFWVCCAITWLVCAGDPLAPQIGAFIVNLTMFPGASGVAFVDGVYWTLALEAKFYLLIVILIGLQRLDRIEPVLWVWLALALMPAGRDLRAFLMSDYAPFFIGGCACFLLSQRPTWSRSALFAAAMIAGTWSSLQLWAWFAATIGQQFQPWLVGGVIAAMYPLMLAIATRRISLPSWPWLAAVGAMSYPCYLLHKQIGGRLFGEWRDVLPWPVLTAVAVAWLLAISWAVAMLVEPRFKRALRRALAPRQEYASVGGVKAPVQTAVPRLIRNSSM